MMQRAKAHGPLGSAVKTPCIVTWLGVDRHTCTKGSIRILFPQLPGEGHSSSSSADSKKRRKKKKNVSRRPGIDFKILPAKKMI